MLATYRGFSLIPSGGEARVVTDVITTTVTTATRTSTTETTTTIITNTTTATTATQTQINIVDQSGGTNANSSGGWNRSDTVLLLILLLVTIGVMAIVFGVLYVRRKRQNLETEFKSVVVGTVPAGGDWWTQGEPPAADSNANDLAHYYPTSTSGSHW
jgi:hypothetical protein